MSLYYPQAAISLRVIWEDFGSSSFNLEKTTVMQVSCRSVSVQINDYSEADTFEASIDYKSFPFDPRCMRACGVAIYMEDRKGVFRRNNSLLLIEPSEDNIIFQGFVDETGIQFNDETRTVNLEGRDFTSLFIDQKRINTSVIPLSKPIDVIVQELINELPAAREIKVDNQTGDLVLPTLAKLAPDYNPVTAVKNQKRKETYWDIIQDIIRRVGLIGYIDIDKFVITKPRNIYQKKEIKQFIYGGNIKSLKFKRKLGRAKNYNVKLVSANLQEKTVLEALVPKEAISPDFIKNFGNQEITIPQLDKDGKKIEPPQVADYITFSVPNISDKKILIDMAENVYEEISRQQIEGSFTTFEMEIPEELENKNLFSTKAVKFSKIRNGTAIKIYLSQEELGKINSDSTLSDKRAFLLSRGYPSEVANAFAESLNRINTALYVKDVKFILDQEDGFQMDIDFINFIDIDSRLLGGI